MTFVEAAGWVAFAVSFVALLGLGAWSGLSWMALVEIVAEDPRRRWPWLLGYVVCCLAGVTFVVWALANVEHWAWVPVGPL